MKTNKGIIGLGLIVAIVLGIVVVGGGAYYLGKNDSKKEINNPVINLEENLIDEDNNGLPDFATLPHNYGDESVQNSKIDCTPNSPSSIKVISPNGGESYTLGQKITVKWSSCNLSSSTHLRAFLQRQAPLPDHEWQIPILFGNIKEGLIDSSLNDGEQVVVLDSAHSVVPASYKLCISEYVTSSGKDVIQDCSDNSFIINSSEESSTEIFKNQPGAIKSVKADGTNKWILAVDLLSSNPNWVPGEGKFFINQNTKIRNLSINNFTKIQNCTTQNSDYGSGFKNDILSFIDYVGSAIKDSRSLEYTAYFDITGSNITAIYEQCLP